MARRSDSTTPRRAVGRPPAPPAGVRVARAVRRALGLPIDTRYQGAPAVARRVIVRVPDEDRCGNSAWFKAEGLCGQTVDAVAVEYTPPGKASPVTIFAYDGDGEGAAKFLEARGDAALGHREIPGAMIVQDHEADVAPPADDSPAEGDEVEA